MPLCIILHQIQEISRIERLTTFPSIPHHTTTGSYSDGSCNPRGSGSCWLALLVPAVAPVASELDEKLVDEGTGLRSIQRPHPAAEQFHTQGIDLGFVGVVVCHDGVD
jgi:hypothetical protein